MSAASFYIPLLAFLAGVAAATVYGSSLPIVTWMCLLGAGVIMVARLYHNAAQARFVSFFGLALIFLSLGMLRLETASWQFGHSQLEAYVGKEITAEGVVVREPDIRASQAQLAVAIGDDVLLVSTDRHTLAAYGDKVQVVGELAKPESFTTELGRTFAYQAYLLAQGIEYRMSFAEVTVLESGHTSSFLAFLFSIKQVFMDSIESVLPEPYAGLGEGLLLGVKQALGEDLESAFRTSGIIHIVVLSGYNIMLVVAFILFALSFVLKKRARLIAALVGIVCFALLVGLSATVVRASIMAGLLLLAEFLGRRYHLPRALLFAAVVMVFLNPYLLVYDVGFQFSFMATLGLILVAPIFESFLADGFSKITFKDFLISTVATQIAVLPLLMYHIGEVSLVAVVVNVLALPVVPLAMLAVFLSGTAGLLSSSLGLFVGSVAYLPLAYIIEVARFFAALPFASFVVPSISGWFMLCLYGLLGISIYLFSNRKKEAGVLTDWTIEEETEKAAEGLRPSAAPAETPVFFR